MVTYESRRNPRDIRHNSAGNLSPRADTGETSVFAEALTEREFRVHPRFRARVRCRYEQPRVLVSYARAAVVSEKRQTRGGG